VNSSPNLGGKILVRLMTSGKETETSLEKLKSILEKINAHTKTTTARCQKEENNEGTYYVIGRE